MKGLVSLIVVLAVLLLQASATYSVIIPFTADLSGANENPANGSPGTGEATVTIDTDFQTMLVEVVFSGLTTPNTASHIHCCTFPPGNIGVATTVPTFTGFPTGVTAGTYSHTFNLMDPATYNPAFVTAHGGLAGAETALVGGIEAGMAYVNIHTTQFPGGEIRGFLQSVSEPSTFVLFGAGLAGVGLFRRKLRK